MCNLNVSECVFVSISNVSVCVFVCNLNVSVCMFVCIIKLGMMSENDTNKQIVQQSFVDDMEEGLFSGN